LWSFCSFSAEKGLVISMSVVLGLDVGTHGIRSIAFDTDMRTVVAAAKIDYPRTCAPGVQEMNPQVMLDAMKKNLTSLFSSLPAGTRVEAMGITHQRGSVIPADDCGNHLGPAFCDSDSRAATVEVLAAYAGVDSERYYKRTGCPFLSFNGLAKVLWVRENQPELYQRAAAWLSPQDYMVSQLTGRLVLTEGSASRNGVLSIRERRLISDLFPDEAFLKHECVPIGETCGTVCVKWSEVFDGLTGTKVIAVPGDQPAAVIGTGAAAGKGLAMNLGTTFVASMCNAVPAFDPAGMVTIEVLPQKLYAMEFGTGAGGQFLDWLVQTLTGSLPADDRFWKQLDAEAAMVSPGAEGLRVVPLMWQVTSPGVAGRISQLSAHHSRAHLVRAVYEGLACEAMISIEKLEACVGTSADTLRVFGGASANENFLRILSAITHKRVLSGNEKQASAYGAALVSALAAGHFETLYEASAVAGTNYQCYLPEREEQYYDGFFEAYCASR
jgi:sugar (pentulose or hexulose) kinase